MKILWLIVQGLSQVHKILVSIFIAVALYAFSDCTQSSLILVLLLSLSLALVFVLIEKLRATSNEKIEETKANSAEKIINRIMNSYDKYIESNERISHEAILHSENIPPQPTNLPPPVDIPHVAGETVTNITNAYVATQNPSASEEQEKADDRLSDNIIDITKKLKGDSEN